MFAGLHFVVFWLKNLVKTWKVSSCPPSTLLFLQEELFNCDWLLLYFKAKPAVFERLDDSVGCVIWPCVSTHCGSWMLAPCQAKQNLIPSAGKARPPLSNPMLSSLVVWSAHTALPPCISPLAWKNILLVFMGLYNTHMPSSKKKKVTWSQCSHRQDSKSQTDQ